MAEITRKRQGEMIRTVFEILLGQPEGLPAREVLAKAEDRLGLTEFEASDYPNRPGVRRWEKTVRFATIGPVKAGWLVKERGRWILTPGGPDGLRAAYRPGTVDGGGRPALSPVASRYPARCDNHCRTLG